MARKVLLSLLLFGGVALMPAHGQPAGEYPVRIRVDAGSPGAAISPTMWGLFFEDINFGADGGLCAELVKNGSFEFPNRLMGWKETRGSAPGMAAVGADGPADGSNRHFLRLTGRTATPEAAIENEGFRGMGVRKGGSYRLEFRNRRPTGASSGLRVELVSEKGDLLATARVPAGGKEWGSRSLRLRPRQTDARARIRFSPLGSGEIDLDNVSLTPTDTWKGRPGGLRRDLVQLLAEIKPGFLRFPGGCIVEGRTLALRYQWKQTLGPKQDRRLLINRWNDEFRHRPAPDYYQSFALGFFEYFQLCEDIGALPLPILNCGMACQFNTGELAPLNALDPYVQDALDLIEFARGAPSTPWGRRRAEMGHPKPFPLHHLGIGNEQWGPQYLERYDRFAAALKARYPDVRLVASAGPSPGDDRFRFLSSELRARKADIIDEHSYANPDWFFDNAHRYDAYDRAGPKVFMGEYAAQSAGIARPENRNTWLTALSEAAFMTGLERNADMVNLSSYAPLFGHVDAWQWTPNLIWFDNLRSVKTANYLVQQAFSLNRGDRLLPIALQGIPATEAGRPRFFASAVLDSKRREIILKLVNATDRPQPVRVDLLGAHDTGRATITTLAAGPDTENTLAQPDRIVPVTTRRRLDSPLVLATEPHSLTILRLAR